MNDDIGEGTVVRHRRHGTSGTVVQRDGNRLYVAWHHSYVKDEVSVDEVETVTDPTPEQRAWCGGTLVIDGGTATIEPTFGTPDDLGWEETHPGQWETRPVACRQPASSANSGDQLVGHLLAVETGVRWMVAYHTTVAEPPQRVVRDGIAETVDTAKQAVADVIRDVLAL